MTDMFKIVLDSYWRQARLYPALLATLPCLVVVIAFWPQLLAPTVTKGVIAFASSLGVLYAMAAFARSRGKRTEKRLLKSWGGWPTTIWLRHRSGLLQPQTTARYHQYLTKHVPGLVQPSASEETCEPENADMQYASAVEWLKEQCRGKNFPLVEKENAEYGFRRNLRGMRPVGLSLCALGVVLPVVTLEYLVGPSTSFTAFFEPPHIWALFSYSWAGAAAVFNAVTAVTWLVVVDDAWVREAADQYARALLANCDAVAAKRTKKI